ncbi:4-hydroxythreonine-4-phosphate dehydrogenase PdxA [Halosquirtibacter laminarini]|uniref:4-hydroxythreonine-4-phosphate dehydrogenase PdxA n=1 Tax=Halosquirtibacter laminarini TaxID=3374600 RepID=A0AC61NEV8_9BACT|nr:4-hydroxythreonine-4-phosphate dehydrogenase PdxA [Prolixibacteraceae bacterium]
MNFQKIKIGITHGDINGVGYEVIIKSLEDDRIFDSCTPIVYGSPKVAAYHKKAIDHNKVSFNQIVDASEAHEGKANILNCISDNTRVELGKSTAIAGESSYMALEKACADLKEGKIDVLITAPICKDNIQSEDFNFPGHTEFLAEQFDSKDHLMLMVSEQMKIGVVAGHIPIAKVTEVITEELVLSKIRVMHQTMKQDFGVDGPRIAVLGLNPHAGDNGLLGDEEENIIIPALKKAQEEGIMAMGPYPADGFFGNGTYSNFDVILAMYHDQGLVPFKALAFDDGVNFTAGLPIIRTSPGHGTAFDIAGKNKASENSFRKAMYLAIDLYRNREIYKDISKSPLQKYDLEDRQSMGDRSI